MILMNRTIIILIITEKNQLFKKGIMLHLVKYIIFLNLHSFFMLGR